MSVQPPLKVAVLAVLLSFGSTSMAQPLKEALADLAQSGPRISAAQNDFESARDQAQETYKRAWRPSVDLTGEAGNQRYDNSGVTPNPEFKGVNRLDARITQLVYDFGQSDAHVREAEAVAMQSSASVSATTEGLVLDALSAHWSVVRAQKALDYATESESKVLNQTKLESAMVDAGKGYESNVLQAKVQLATAQARRIRAEGALDVARARVAAVWGSRVAKVAYDEVALPRSTEMPATLDDALRIALDNNKQIQIGAHRTAALRERVQGSHAREFRPTLELIGEAAQRRDMDGTVGTVNDSKILLQLKYSFNAGMAGSAALDSVRKSLVASEQRELDTRELVLEQVKVAWRNLQVARNNRDILQNQVNIATKFLEMATAERQLGRRSLLDVLSAEMALITAQSDLASTEADEAIASLTLLQSIGRLNLDVLEYKPATIGS